MIIIEKYYDENGNSLLQKPGPLDGYIEFELVAGINHILYNKLGKIYADRVQVKEYNINDWEEIPMDKDN